MTTDLQADLDQLADEVDVIAGNVQRVRYEADSHALWDIMHRLRHLLDDRGIDQAPLRSEIVAHLKAGGEVWRATDAATADPAWQLDTHSARLWRTSIDRFGDRPAWGHRLVPISPEPATERVRLDQIIGRTLPDQTAPILYVTNHARGWQAFTGRRWRDLDLAPDGTVEVLRVDPT